MKPDPTDLHYHLRTETELLKERPERAKGHDAFTQMLAGIMAPDELKALRALDEPIAAWVRQAPENAVRFFADPLAAITAAGLKVPEAAQRGLRRLHDSIDPQKLVGAIGKMPPLGKVTLDAGKAGGS